MYVIAEKNHGLRRFHGGKAILRVVRDICDQFFRNSLGK